MRFQTRDQRYASDVFSKVSDFGKQFPKETGQKERESYGTMAHRLPVLIRTAGLAQALAFVEAKATGKADSEKPRQRAYRQLLKDLGKTVSRADLAEAAREADFLDYMRLTEQVIEALIWYKRYAESVLGVELDQEDRDQ